MLPIFLNLTNHLAVVIGGGPVGRRKAAALRDGGARVRLVCLEARPAEESSPDLEWLTEAYRTEHLDGASLVLAAATRAVNQAVVADARRRGIWVNAASDSSHGDFYLPATVRRGDFLLAIGTGGAAPDLAQAVRVRLEAEFDEAFGQWVALLAELRPVILRTIPQEPRRRELFAQLSRWEWLDRLRREDVERVRLAMRATIQDLPQDSADPL